MRQRTHAIWQDGVFLPREISERNTGLRPSVQAVLSLIDTTDPAWPGVAAVLQEFVAAGIEIDAAAAEMAVKLGRQRWAAEPVNTQPALVNGTYSIVYYIRRGPLIKIGTTINPRSRFRDLMPDAILAVEPGDRQQETARHRQFIHLQVRRYSEYFQDAPELQEHIRGILAIYGDPDTSWPDVGTRTERWPLVLAKSTDTVTTKEAAEQLGIRRDTIHAWVSRGRITPAGRDERRQLLFYREHLIRLRDAPRSRRSAYRKNPA